MLSTLQMGNQGSETIVHSPKVTQLVAIRMGMMRWV